MLYSTEGSQTYQNFLHFHQHHPLYFPALNKHQAALFLFIWLLIFHMSQRWCRPMPGLFPRQSGFWNHSCCQRWQDFFVFNDGEYSIVCVTFVHPHVHTLSCYPNLLTRGNAMESMRGSFLFNMLTLLPLAIHLTRIIRSLNGFTNFRRSLYFQFPPRGLPFLCIFNNTFLCDDSNS